MPLGAAGPGWAVEWQCSYPIELPLHHALLRCHLARNRFVELDTPSVFRPHLVFSLRGVVENVLVQLGLEPPEFAEWELEAVLKAKEGGRHRMASAAGRARATEETTAEARAAEQLAATPRVAQHVEGSR